ncbi:MAG: CatB-related O-acetyltransferase [Desulfuromonadaceae bacterium]|nr:CatB-related O-acetyltransferase [Desulfuromonadaceae bacterium]
MDSETVCTAPLMTFGRGTYWGPNTRFLKYLYDEQIIIGSFCSIGDYVVIQAGGEHRTDLVSTWSFDEMLFKKKDQSRSYKFTPHTTIGNDVWIGYGAYINSGVQIGSGAVIGAQAAVFQDVPPYAVVMGNPATVVRYRFSQRTVERLLKIAWWDWPQNDIEDSMEWFYGPIDEFLARFDPEGE